MTNESDNKCNNYELRSYYSSEWAINWIPTTNGERVKLFILSKLDLKVQLHGTWGEPEHTTNVVQPRIVVSAGLQYESG